MPRLGCKREPLHLSSRQLGHLVGSKEQRLLLAGLGEQMANSSHQTWHLELKKQYVLGTFNFSPGSQTGDWKV